jgi:hypothetical protein
MKILQGSRVKRAFEPALFTRHLCPACGQGVRAADDYVWRGDDLYHRACRRRKKQNR